MPAWFFALYLFIALGFIGFVAVEVFSPIERGRSMSEIIADMERNDPLYMEPPKKKGVKRKPFWAYANDPGNQPDD
jgi:hypothetical protein